MYLYKETRHETGNEIPWLKYEMQPIDRSVLVPEDKAVEFISPGVNEARESGFISMAGKPDKPVSPQAEGGTDPMEKIALAEREAYEKGFAQGEKDGLELGEAKADKLLGNLETLLEEISQFRQSIGKKYEKELLNLVHAIAKKIIQSELRLSETAVKGTILSALELTAEKRSITLKISPEDFEYVEKIRPELLSEYTSTKSLEIISDSTISRGGCILETPSGDIDASIETQLENIYQALKDTSME